MERRCGENGIRRVGSRVTSQNNAEALGGGRAGGVRGRKGWLSKIVKLNKRSAAGKIGRNAITVLPPCTKGGIFSTPNISPRDRIIIYSRERKLFVTVFLCFCVASTTET